MNVSAKAQAVIVVLVSVVAGLGLGHAQGCATTAQSAKAAKAEADFCKARAQYTAIAALAGGRLDPAPGSARASLEAAEDEFCASVGKDGGP